MAVHYRFRSALEFESVPVDSAYITVADLKKAICAKMGLTEPSSDLEVTNEQTKKAYAHDGDLIPKNTSVIIRRVPIRKGWKGGRSVAPVHTAPSQAMKTTHTKLTGETEAEKIAQLTQAGTEGNWKSSSRFGNRQPRYKAYHAEGEGGGSGGGGGVKPGYICRRCNEGGHDIQDCPTNGDPRFDVVKVAKSTGIPKFFQTLLQDGDVNPGGNEGLVIVNADTYTFKQSVQPVLQLDDVEERVQCPVCHGLLREAVVLPCCLSTFCDSCIRKYLMSHDFICPSCETPEVITDLVEPDHDKRAEVEQYLREEQAKARDASMKIASMAPAPAPTVLAGGSGSYRVAHRVVGPDGRALADAVPAEGADAVKSGTDAHVNEPLSLVESTHSSAVKREAGGADAVKGEEAVGAHGGIKREEGAVAGAAVVKQEGNSVVKRESGGEGEGAGAGLLPLPAPSTASGGGNGQQQAPPHGAPFAPPGNAPGPMQPPYAGGGGPQGHYRGPGRPPFMGHQGHMGRPMGRGGPPPFHGGHHHPQQRHPGQHPHQQQQHQQQQPFHHQRPSHQQPNYPPMGHNSGPGRFQGQPPARGGGIDLTAGARGGSGAIVLQGGDAASHPSDSGSNRPPHPDRGGDRRRDEGRDDAQHRHASPGDRRRRSPDRNHRRSGDGSHRGRSPEHHRRRSPDRRGGHDARDRGSRGRRDEGRRSRSRDEGRHRQSSHDRPRDNDARYRDRRDDQRSRRHSDHSSRGTKRERDRGYRSDRR